MSYTKLFSSIITSTIWNEDDKTRILWITMLAIADKNGEVQGSVPGLARIAGISIEDTRIGIQKFLSPDPDSRTKDDEGRRIEEIEGGWLLLNHRKYREMASKEEAKEAEAKRKARYRAKLARNGNLSQNVPDESQDVPEKLHIAEAEAEADTKEEVKIATTTRKKREPRKTEMPTLEQIEDFVATIPNIPKSEALALYGKWKANGFTVSDKPIKDWQATIRNWNDRGFLDYQKNPSKHGIPRPIHDVKPFRSTQQFFNRGED